VRREQLAERHDLRVGHAGCAALSASAVVNVELASLGCLADDKYRTQARNTWRNIAARRP